MEHGYRIRGCGRLTRGRALHGVSDDYGIFSVMLNTLESPSASYSIVQSA